MTLRALTGVRDGGASSALAPAVVASIALHAALLAGLPELWTYSERPATSPLNAWLVPGARTAAVADPLPAATAAPERVVEQPGRTASSRKPAAIATAPAAVPTAERVERAQSPAAAPAAEVAASAPAAGPGEAAQPVLAPGSPTLAPRPGDDALEAGSLAQYRLALIGTAKRLKLYPPQAIDRGLEGRVDVRLVIGTGGEPATVSVRRSSGHDVLDRQAVETLRRASAATPIPPALRDRAITVEIPVLYELKNAS